MPIDHDTHYWIVGNKPNKVFSGKDVSDADEDYLVFLENNAATRILSDGELADVLAQRGAPASLIRAAGWSNWGNVSALDIIYAMSSAGVNVTSTSTPAINAIYGCTPDRQSLLVAEALYVQTTGGAENGTFSNGQNTRSWQDVDGMPHIFTTAQFIEFAQKIASYVDSIHTYAFGNKSGSPPTSNITIQ
jgi:hypothetical protein